jgi:transcriptional regulator with XRE-family HTH domain
MGELNRQLLKNLRALRELKNLSQIEMAKKIGLTQTSYARLEEGKRKTPFDTLEVIAEALDVDICALIHFHETGLYAYSGQGSKEDLEELSERERLLSALNTRMREQLEDKNQIIELLKKGGD